MRKSEKIEAVGLAFSPRLRISGGKAAELDQARFVGVEFQIELSESLPKVFPEPLGVGAVLEANHKVVGKTDDDDIPARLLPSPLFGP